MKKNFALGLFLFLSAVCCMEARAQYAKPTVGIYINSPFALFYKWGFGLEYRIYEDNSLLLNYSNYNGFFPGYQASLQYRLYFNTNRVAENLIYFKGGTGFAGYDRNSYVKVENDMNNGPGTYYFGGAGVGRHFSYRSLFWEVTAGLKFSLVANPPAMYNERLFYTVGPGSIPDLHLTIGLQF